MKTLAPGNLVKLVGIFAVALAADANIVTGPIPNPANGHSYYLLSQNTWTASEAEAVTLGGHLATINDQAENDWVYTTFSNYGGVRRNLWIGLTDQVMEGTFVWTSGEPVSFLNWDPTSSEPNNYGGDENCVHMFSPYWGRGSVWNDYQGYRTTFYDGLGIYGVVEVATIQACTIVGLWDWNAGNPSPAGTAVFEFKADGNFYSYDLASQTEVYWAGNWVESAPLTYTLSWWHGYIDTLTMSSDCNMLDGHNQYNLHVWAYRRSGGQTCNMAIICPDNITTSTDPGVCEAALDPGTAIATGGCSSVSVAGVRRDGLALTAPYPKGVTIITWTATDAAGHSANCTQTITVDDHENPTIVPLEELFIASDPGSCSASAVTLRNPKTADNCEVANVINNYSSNNFPLGETLVTWTVTDSSGNTATTQQKITVLASVSPTFLPPLATLPVANKIRRGQVVPHKVALVNCSGAPVLAGVTVKLKVQGIDTATGEVFQEVPEDANGVGNDGTVTSDGIMVLTDGKYQFNLDTSNFGDPNTFASPTRYYRSTVTIIDNSTLTVLGAAFVSLETRQ